MTDSKNDPRLQDPHFEREAEKYENPIPSREYLLEVLDKAPGPMSHPAVCEALKISDEDGVEAVRRRLIAMARDGQLLSNRKGDFAPLDKTDLIRGRVLGHRDGFGFVERADGGADIYLHNRQMRRVFHGDEVLVRLRGQNHRGKEEGAIVEVLKRNTEQIAGRFVREQGIQLVQPENSRVTQDILIPAGAEGDAQEGQIVVVAITQQPEKQHRVAGKVIRVMGDHMAPGMEIDLAIEVHGIPNSWPAAVLDQAKGIPPEVQEEDKVHRVDLRDKPFITIDGEDARDFDDAVLCEKRKDGWRLYVAIADVSHYVHCESPLDREAQRRATSVYFPDYVVPMLPEALSNGLCSLNPEVDRLCLVCEANLNNQGEVTSYQFFEGVIHSHARMTYTQVGEILAHDGDDEHPMRKTFNHVLPQVHLLHGLYKCLRKARDERGAIDFDTVETRIVFNDARKIEEIVPVRRNDAHKLIEEAMLCANVCAADFLASHKIPCLYRVHEGPTEERLAGVREFLSELGLDLPGGDQPSSADYQTLMQKIADRPDSHTIQMVMLRSLRQAVYQVENKGHFGLGYDAYAHFTSPIRRYPDLMVHRAIRSVIRSDRQSDKVRRVEGAKPLPKDVIYPYDTASVVGLGDHCSVAERRADEATRDVVSWLKCEYLMDRVGEVFPGVVTAATNFGLFVELKDLYVEGLVHITALPSDYYHFDPVKHRLVGDRTRQVFGLSDELTVRVVRVDLDSRKVDFELESVIQANRASGNKPAAKSNKGKGKGSQGKSGQAKSGQGKSGQGKSGQGKGGQGKSGQDKSGQGKPAQNKRGRSGRGRADRGASDGKHGKARQRPSSSASVRPTQKPAAPEKQSVFAKAASGVKKALARFTKKK
ncbi:ribonuclease R [Marinimicrobium alkaliphilum]|uniref:ribonuclease R n=1 Tax=Marinimicrobium alkaliphilum TaxID=2202654 RepID=UPI000DBA2998|nr:ribonuclease R [Marinimicrobium alkaliphilum]